MMSTQQWLKIRELLGILTMQIMEDRCSVPEARTLLLARIRMYRANERWLLRRTPYLAEKK